MNPLPTPSSRPVRVAGQVRGEPLPDSPHAPETVLCGHFERSPRWLCSIVSFVCNWDEACRLHLTTLGPRPPGVWLYSSQRRIRSVVNLRGGSPKVASALGALDACLQFALAPEPDGEADFHYAAVFAQAPQVTDSTAFDWAVDQFCLSLNCLFDVVDEEAPQIQSSGIASRSLRLAGPAQDVLAGLETEPERLLAGAMWPVLAQGGSFTVKEAAETAGITQRSAAALLSRLWRMAALTDRA